VSGTGADLLAALPLFSRLEPDQLAELAGSVRIRRLSKSGVLFHRGVLPTGFYIVVDGVIKLSVVAPDGTEKVVEVMHPGDSFGEAVMFLGEPYPVTATALEPTQLLLLPIDVVDRLLERDPLFARRLLAGLSVKLHGLVRDVQSFALQSSRQRVISHLLDGLAPKQGEQPVVELATSKQVLASRLSLTPETLSRVLRELSAEGLIGVQGRRIELLDLPRLRSRGPAPAID
jgi:CRP-like cAMP-binding protein